MFLLRRGWDLCQGTCRRNRRRESEEGRCTVRLSAWPPWHERSCHNKNVFTDIGGGARPSVECPAPLGALGVSDHAAEAGLTRDELFGVNGGGIGCGSGHGQADEGEDDDGEAHVEEEAG